MMCLTLLLNSSVPRHLRWCLTPSQMPYVPTCLYRCLTLQALTSSHIVAKFEYLRRIIDEVKSTELCYHSRVVYTVIGVNGGNRFYG